MDFYRQSEKEVFKELRTSANGLTQNEAEQRLAKYGFNELKQEKQISPLKILLEQFNDPLIWVLFAAILISALIGYHEYVSKGGKLFNHLIEPLVISVILVLNAVLGFLQEFRAEKAIEALKKLASQTIIVVRDSKQKEIDARLLVPGDIILLSAGKKIPADARIIDVHDLQTQEASLTGESFPVTKQVVTYHEELALGSRKNMIFAGTIVTQGRGKAVVIQTGMQTQIGKIARLIEESPREMTPLQKKLEELGKFLGMLVLGISILVFITGILRNPEVLLLIKSFDLLDLLKNEVVLAMLITAVSLAVAAIPEGLPAVVTISLSLGVKRMIEKNAIIRKLSSVETLGSTDVICTDKTGTLTYNEMTVKKIYVDNAVIDVDGAGYEPKGTFSQRAKDLNQLLTIGVLNNDAFLKKENGEYSIMGDPTEGAIIVSAAKAGIIKAELEKKFPREEEITFDAKRKMMTTVHTIQGKRYAFVKGAPDMLIEKCSSILINGEVKKLSKERKKKLHAVNEQFSGKALRVLGFAQKEIGKENKEHYERDLIFVGLQGMIDPPRQEVKEAIAKCKSAGIRVIMITGDFKGTAVAIAEALGIQGKAITGKELADIDIDQEIENINVFARVNPEDKMDIVNALKKKGYTVAMTGDGVNDAPALQRADIGIAMGITGTDVAKEASDMILTDDNFASIVGAVEEGRNIYDNIRKFVLYLLSSNVGEVLVIFISMLLGMPLPLIPLQLLWINLVTDGLPATALSVDPAEKGIMKRKPRPSNSKIINKVSLSFILLVGIIITLGTLGGFYYNLHQPQQISVKDNKVFGNWEYKGSYYDFIEKNKVGNAEEKEKKEILLQEPRSFAFTILMMFQMFNVINSRSLRQSGFSGLFSNKILWLAIFSSVFLQVMAIHSPLHFLFKTTPLTLTHWGLLIIIAGTVFIAGELYKLVIRQIHVSID